LRRHDAGVGADHGALRRRSGTVQKRYTKFVDDILFLEWSAESAHTRVEDGIDTFVFREGLIRVQTVRYTLQRKD
jgi:hypothetical protein